MNHTNTNASPLPGEIEALISRVVKRARLRKAERRDVERELRSHFAEGMAEGKTAAELVGEFGDAKASARLIGRAKRRCRGIVWHAWVWSCRGVMALFALVVVTYAWAAWAYYGAKPTITRNYLKEMNAKVEAIPMEDRAWPLYRQALLSTSRDDVDRLYDFGYDIKEGAPEWGELEDIVARNQGAIDLALQGSTRPAFGDPASSEGDTDLHAWWGIDERDSSRQLQESENPPLRTLDGRSVIVMKQLAYLLRSDARVALAENDGARWTRDMVAIMRMATHAGGSSQMLDYLVAISLHQMADGWVGEALALHPERISDEELAMIAHELDSSLDWKREIPFEDEKRSAEDSIQRLYNARTGRITAEGMQKLAEYYRSMLPLDEDSKQIMEPPTLLGPVNAMVMVTREEALARVGWMFDSWERRAHTPVLDRGKDEVRTWVEEKPLLDIFNYRWWSVFAGTAIGFGSERLMDRMVMETQALNVAIAIELFRRHAGRLPAVLDELVPRFLPEVPIDIFSGEGLRYIVKDGIPIVYSVGCDMDDDGGREPEKSIGRWAISAAADGPPRAAQPEWWTEERIREYDGDWLLWPRFDRDTREFVFRKPDATTDVPAN